MFLVCNAGRRKTKLAIQKSLLIVLSTFVSFVAHSQDRMPLGKETVSVKRLASGILYKQRIISGDSPLIINVLKADMKTKGVRVEAGQANDAITLGGSFEGRAPVTEISSHNEPVAAINADFFPFTGDPLGLEIRNGELLSEPLYYRACLGFSKHEVKFGVLTASGTWFSGAAEGKTQGVNRLPGASEITFLSPTFHAGIKSPRKMTLIPLEGEPQVLRVSEPITGRVGKAVSVGVGDTFPEISDRVGFLAVGDLAESTLKEGLSLGEKISVLFDLRISLEPELNGKYRPAGAKESEDSPIVWNDIKQAISGGPWLVKQGKLFIDGEAEGFDLEKFVHARHPRTAIGFTSRHELLLVTVDGRAKWSQGVSLSEMSKIMLEEGAVNAINLDGGGSTTMTLFDHVVNAPSDGRVRPVANALMIFSGSPEGKKRSQKASDFRTMPERTIPLEKSVALDTGEELDERNPLTWGTEDGFGFVNQEGIFRSYKPGKGKVFATSGKKTFVFPISVAP